MPDVQLITLDPGHFHAALVQKEMYPGVSPQVHVYAPLGPDLLAHLGRIVGFNTRADRPTGWDLEIHARPDFLERLRAERPGNVVVLAGRNRRKMDYIQAALDLGMHVLADKPWIIRPEDLPRLENALAQAAAQRLIALDIMTERYEITSILQRELVNTPDLFGNPLPGTADEPGIFMESVHYLLKTVAGAPLRRPHWFFDVHEQGEGLSDVGTHLVDLIPWILFPDQPINRAGEVQLQSAARWPTLLTREDYSQITGERDFSESLRAFMDADRLAYFCNTRVNYLLRGIHVRLDVLWDLKAEPGAGDTHFAVFRGSRSRIEVRQRREENFRPELFVVPNNPSEAATLLDALRHKLAMIASRYPGLAIESRPGECQVTIPDSYRSGHEAHFAEVTRRFLECLEQPDRLPAWEQANMMAKYHVTTQGVEIAQNLTQIPGD